MFFVGLNFIIWKLFTEDILTDNVKSGDYTRVGYIIGSSYDSKPGYQGTGAHMESWDYQNEPVDLITIGDSFSNSCGKRGMFYQDWIASHRHLNVLNIHPISGADFFNTVVIMLNSGFLDELNARAVLIQRVERHVFDSFAKDFDIKETRPIKDVWNDFKKVRYVNNPPRLIFLNIGNFKFILYSFLRKFYDNAFFSKVYMRDLEKPFFNVQNERSLIWGHEDISHLADENDLTIQKVNDNLNALAEALSKKRIKLYFMPVVDKYNLYSDFLVRNPYPKSYFFEKIRSLPKKYELIDTKSILSPFILKGEKDVYWADDSHWSWESAEAVMKGIKF